jgi:hypothetical protein
MTARREDVKDEPARVSPPLVGLDKKRPGFREKDRVEVVVRVDLGRKLASRPACVWLGAAPVEKETLSRGYRLPVSRAADGREFHGPRNFLSELFIGVGSRRTGESSRTAGLSKFSRIAS